jgi:CMP-N,N'-diacetyllegionaminic acid synthase
MHGKPLLNWSIEHALATPEVDKLVVTADFALDSRYHEYNIGRPLELTGDDVSKWEVWRWVADYWEAQHRKVDAICDLDPTQPLRTVADISGCVGVFSAGGCPVVAGVAEAGLSPYYDILEKTPSGVYRISKGGGAYMCRQELPSSYVQSGIYVVSREALRARRYLFDGPVCGYEMPRERSFDINDETDWRVVELFL